MVPEFLTDIKTLRERARQKIEEGPITAAYGALVTSNPTYPLPPADLLKPPVKTDFLNPKR